MLNDVTFLRKDQIVGQNRLNIFKKYGTRAAITDFAILLGGSVSKYDFTNEGRSLKTRTGSWWTQTPTSDKNTYIIFYDGKPNPIDTCIRFIGARPALSYSDIKEDCQNIKQVEEEILEVEYGEYPSWLAPDNIALELEKEFQNNTLIETGKKYTTDSIDWQDIHDFGFVSRKHIEYQYNGKKYIRLIGDYNGIDSSFNNERKGKKLSNGKNVKLKEPYWICVEPIQYLVDEKEDIALTKNIVFSGVQFNIENNYYRGYFLYTEIKKYLDRYWIKEIDPNYLSKEDVVSKVTNWDFASKLWYYYMDSDMLWDIIDKELERNRTANQQKTRPTIRVSDVINKEYTKDCFNISDANKFLVAMRLSSATEEQYEVVREFMKQLGPKACTAFELMWSHGDEQLFEHVLEINQKEHNQKVRKRIK